MVKLNLKSWGLICLIALFNLSCKVESKTEESEAVSSQSIAPYYYGDIHFSGDYDTVKFKIFVDYLVLESYDPCDNTLNSLSFCENPTTYKTTKRFTVDSMQTNFGDSTYTFFFDVNHPSIQPDLKENEKEYFQIKRLTANDTLSNIIDVNEYSTTGWSSDYKLLKAFEQSGIRKDL